MITAKVPLLKFRDNTLNINVDLNIHNIVGIRNTRLLKAYVDCKWFLFILTRSSIHHLIHISGDARFPRLVLAAKRWAKTNDINDAHRKTLSSYSITLMVLHYLQGNFDGLC